MKNRLAKLDHSPVITLGLLALFTSTAYSQGNYLEVWAQQFGTSGGDHVRDVAAGPSGVFVGGDHSVGIMGGMFPQPDGFVSHFDGDGVRLWDRRLSTPESDEIRSVASDGQGGVIVGGRTRGSLGGTAQGEADAFVARYDALGNQVWILQFGSPEWDTVRAVVGDGIGGAFATGTTQVDGIDSTFVTRISPMGTQVWTREFRGLGFDEPTSLALDGAGGLYLTGRSSASFWGPNLGGLDCYLARMDGAGSLLWSKQFGSSDSDSAFAIAVVGPNELYVGGSTRGDLFGPSPLRFQDVAFVARFDGNGALVWGSRVGSPMMNRVSDIKSLVAAAGGGVVALGSEGPIPGGASVGSFDVYRTRLDDQGLQGDIRSYNTADVDLAAGLALGPDGQLYLAGTTAGELLGLNAGQVDSFLIRLEPQVGTAYCGTGVPNSTGMPARILATGSDLASDNALRLQVLGMPPGRIGLFRASMDQAFVPGAGGSQGNLCLGGSIGNYAAAGQVQQSDASGRMQLAVDLTQTPTSMGTVAVLSGQTWNFQAWYRDANPAETSNYTDGVTLGF